MNSRSTKLPLLLLAAATASGALAQPMRLEEAVAIARANAHDVLTAQQEARRTRGVVSELRAAALPSLDVTGTYTRFPREIRVEFDPGQDPLVVRPIDRANLGMRLSGIVDLSGVTGLAISGTGALVRAADAMVDAASNDAAVLAKGAFFGVLQAEEFVEVAEEQLANAQLQLEMARRRVAAGTAPRFDEIRLEAEVSRAEEELIQARNGLQIARSAFNYALARDVDAPVELIAPATPPPISLTLTELTDLAIDNRPELAAAGYSAEYRTRLRQARQKENLPTLNLSADFAYDPRATGFGAERETLSATAVLSFPLWDSGRRRARVQQAHAEEAQAIIAIDRVAQSVELEVRQAYLDVLAARQSIEAAQKRVATATEALRLANVRYEAGVGTTLEVSDAGLLFVSARTALVNAGYAYHDAVARLQRAVGSEEIF